jgi:hypothetical protein
MTMGQTYPLPLPDATPVYVPVITYFGGAPLDVEETHQYETGTANATNDYAPRTQLEKAGASGSGFTGIAEDIGRRRGFIAPGQPYGPVPAAPTLTSVVPDTAEAGGNAVVATLTGTGFTPWSTVETGGVPTPYFQYVSPTQIQLLLDAKRSVPGTIDIIVHDHATASAPAEFTFTEPA